MAIPFIAWEVYLSNRTVFSFSKIFSFILHVFHDFFVYPPAAPYGDTDGDTDTLDSLPTEIEIPDNISEDEISDYISDITGYCHTGYALTNNKE